jgi:membrane-associated phospholipid phosphatase
VSQQFITRLVAVILILFASSSMVSPAAGQVPAPTPSSQNPQEAQEPEQTSPPAPSKTKSQSFLRSFSQDEWRMWSSPFRGSTYGSHTVRKYGIPFLLLSGAAIATDPWTADLLPNTTEQTKWSRRVSQVGAAYTLAGICGGSYLLGHVGGNEHMKETGWLGLQAIAHTQIFVFALKQATNRVRPATHDKHPTFWRGGDSFPSGHSATSFAVATVFAYEYRHHIAVPITAYSLATLVAFSRFSGQKHWVSDVFVGGSMGFLIGRFVYKNHHNPDLPGSPVSRTSRLIPEVGVSGRGFFCIWNL